MTQAVQLPNDLVDMLRRDLTQIQLLADLNALDPENLRRLLGSLGELVNVVETITELMRESIVPAPARKASVFADLKARFHHLPVNRVQYVGHLGVIDGGLSS